METSLHRQLKDAYASPSDELEVKLDNYRIDVVRGDELVEIQHGSLAAIRDKIGELVKEHNVLIVKPIVQRKKIIKQSEKSGDIVSQRMSPKRGSLLDLFDELIYMTRVFPHPNLTIEVALVDIEEWRYPGHGKRRRWRKTDHVVEDQRLVKVAATHRFSTTADLRDMLPDKLPRPFHTGHLSDRLGVKRWFAQRIAYCFRKMGAAQQVGKEGNTVLYDWKT